MRKTVSFNDFSTVVVVQEKSDATDLWYNNEEFRAIRADTEVVMEDDSSQRRRNHVRSVLALQEEHKDHQIVDETGLKRYSSALSKEDLKKAQRRASQTSMDAFQFHSDHKEISCYLRARDAEEYSKPTKAKIALRRSVKSMGSIAA